MERFEALSESELKTLQNAVAQIAILVAGADDNIDADEKAWASKMTAIRSFSGDRWLREFYEVVGENFKSDFERLIQVLPTNTTERQAALSKEIAMVNPILAKLELYLAFRVYDSYLSFARRIAEASGGILGFGTVSEAENQWLMLPMITPIAEPPKVQGK